MAKLCRADSRRQVFNTIEFLHNDIQTCITFQTRDQSHASEFPLTSDGLQLIQIRDGLYS